MKNWISNLNDSFFVGAFVGLMIWSVSPIFGIYAIFASNIYFIIYCILLITVSAVNYINNHLANKGKENKDKGDEKREEV